MDIFNIAKIKEYLTKSDIKRTLKEFEKLFQWANSIGNEEIKGDFKEYYEDYILFSSTYFRLEKKERQRTITIDETTKEYNFVIKGLFKLYIDIEEIFEKYTITEINHLHNSSKQIPLVSICAAAGNGGDGTQGILNEHVKDWVVFSEAENGKSYVAIKVKGNSMNPIYKENDTLICQKVNHNEIVSGNVYVIVNQNDEVNLKRVYLHIKNKHYILKSDNPLYKDKIVTEINTAFWLVRKKC